MFDTKKFGAYICKLRKDADLTQSELAEILCVTRQTVSKYECGDNFPDISILMLIAEKFIVTVDTLINAGEPSKAESLVLASAAFQKSIPEEIFKNCIGKDIVNIAPFIKPSLLDNIAEGLSNHGINISQVVELAKYMSDKSIIKLLESV